VGSDLYDAAVVEDDDAVGLCWVPMPRSVRSPPSKSVVSAVDDATASCCDDALRDPPYERRCADQHTKPQWYVGQQQRRRHRQAAPRVWLGGPNLFNRDLLID
jgi:hypothetical protein